MKAKQVNFRKILRVTVVTAAGLWTSSYATASLALGTAEQRIACTPDVFRLCSSEIPDVDQIISCMKAKKASLSQACRSVFDPPAARDQQHYQLSPRRKLTCYLEIHMKTLGFAMTLALMSSAAYAGAVFEVPINGGMARIQLGDDCGQPVCASVSWTDNEARQARKEQHRKKAAKPAASGKAETAPGESLPPPDPAPAAANATGKESSASVTGTPAQAQARANASVGGARDEPPAMASHNPEPQVAPQAPVEEPKAEASPAPPHPAVSTAKASAKSPIGEWLAEGGEARVRIEECGTNLCGVVSAAKNANETDRKNPNPRLRSRPILGLPVLIDMKPVEKNLWEGRIYNAKNGQTYIASISLDDPQTLRVEGCAFGGLICGDRTWTRVN